MQLGKIQNLKDLKRIIAKEKKNSNPTFITKIFNLKKNCNKTKLKIGINNIIQQLT